MKLNYFLLLVCVFYTSFSLAQNVGVGTSTPMSKLDVEGGVSVGTNYSGTTAAPINGAIIEGAVGVGTSAPNASAQLQVLATNKGLLIPNVALTATNSVTPITSPATSLLVYNTATAGNVTPGYYYWSGTAWQRFDTGNNTGDWKLDGNSNGIIRSIGTNDNFDLPFETNGTEKMRILANGNVGIGTASPNFKLQVQQDMTMDGDVTAAQMVISGATTNGKRMIFGYDTNGDGFGFIKSGNLGVTWTPIALQPNGGNVGIGITNPTENLSVRNAFASSIFSVSNSANHFFSAYSGSPGDQHVALISDNGQAIRFGQWGDLVNRTWTERMRIDVNGNVGIGNTAPSYKLHVAGDVYANGGWLRASGNAGFYCETHGGGWHMTDATWMRSYNDKAVYVNNVVRANGGFQVDGNQVIDADAGWHRSYGATGWYNQTYGGGWFVQG
ncbi:MAG: shufflon system plasmid conjugative transfer pilus tip adhesin PilV, partial [Bacteroidia bacterium]